MLDWMRKRKRRVEEDTPIIYRERGVIACPPYGLFIFYGGDNGISLVQLQDRDVLWATHAEWRPAELDDMIAKGRGDMLDPVGTLLELWRDYRRYYPGGEE